MSGGHTKLALPLLLFCIYTVSAFRSMQETIVHIDMKGSAPRPAYLKQTMKLVSQLGATGILLEWEDMFPFQGSLGEIVNGDAYTIEDVDDVLTYAQNLGLSVIPLVQTLGHAEWVLKTEMFNQYREHPDYPMVFCIGNLDASLLITDMLHQVADVHNKYGMPFIHIGADEAYQLGICEDDKRLLNTTFRNSTKRLVFNHMQTIAMGIATKFPRTKVLAWFDEFKSADKRLVDEYGLSGLIEPVVWKYTDNLDKDLPAEMWRNLSKMFANVWGASAYKGSNGSDQIYNQMTPYFVNNRQWFLQALQHRDKFTEFRGMILTGWSRYDHFASLCEVLPTSMTSLAINIQLVQNFVLTENAALNMMRVLKCPDDTTVDQLMKNADKCHFPGYRVRDVIRDLISQKTYYTGSTWISNRERGWLKAPQQLAHNTNPYYVDVLRTTYIKLLNKLDSINANLRKTMDEIFYPETAIEFQITYVDEFYDDLSKKLDAVIEVDKQGTWLPRPVFGPPKATVPPPTPKKVKSMSTTTTTTTTTTTSTTTRKTTPKTMPPSTQPQPKMLTSLDLTNDDDMYYTDDVVVVNSGDIRIRRSDVITPRNVAARPKSNNRSQNDSRRAQRQTPKPLNQRGNQPRRQPTTKRAVQSTTHRGVTNKGRH